jgi:hypothetical protein
MAEVSYQLQAQRTIHSNPDKGGGGGEAAVIQVGFRLSDDCGIAAVTVCEIKRKAA